MMLGMIPQSSHWYTQSGEPSYDSTLREARKYNLLPSVSTVAHFSPNDVIENWRIEQAILSAITLPRTDGESDDAFAKRVRLDMDKEGDEARENGEKIHKLSELYISGAPESEYPDIDAKFKPVITSLLDWIDVTLEPGGVCEKNIVELDHGYGGRVDYYNTATSNKMIFDLKSQNVKKSSDGKRKPRINYYDEWAYQLAAYAFALNVPFDRCFSVVVSTNVEVPMFEVYQWSKGEIELAHETFLALLHAYRCVKKFPYVRNQEAAA